MITSQPRSLTRGASFLALICLAQLFSVQSHATNAAYVHIVKKETPDTRFHLGELEAFANGVTPNNAGGSSYGGMTTSTNDILPAGTYGDGNTYPTLGTTSALEHGGANRLPNNNLENAGAVWSTANGIGSNAQYTLDLGGTQDVTTLRLWPRADGCCSNRWRNLEIQLLDANRSPIPGTLNTHAADTGNVPLEFTYPDASSINSFSVSPQTTASNEAVTLTWNVEPAATAISIDQGVGNVLGDTTNGFGTRLLDPGPASTTTYTLSVTADGEVSTAQATVTIDNDPVIHSFGASETTVSAGTDVTLSWDVANFDSLELNGAPVEGGGDSIVVSPLATTTYTLTALNASGNSTAELTIIVTNVPDLIGVNGRFIEVVKNDVADTQLHIAEIEVFQFGVDPDEADADGTSSNDIVQSVNPSAEFPPTTTNLEHGDPASVFDGDIESGAAVWTTSAGLGTEPLYMLDLGTTNTINTVRIFGRGDNCCLNRLQNFTVNIYADDGGGSPGELLNSVSYPGVAPAGNLGHVELSLAIPNPGVRSFTVDKSFIPQGGPITLSWEVNTDSTSVSISGGVGDVTGLTDGTGTGSIVLNPGPNADTTYTLTAVRPTGTSTAQVAVEVTDQPLIFSFEADAGIVSPGTPVALTWDVANVSALDLNGSAVTGMAGTSVTPASSTTYTLTATNPNGTTTEELRIRVALPGEPIISEFLADNAGGLQDEDGETSDWIELCNPTGDPASLDGYYLTDSPGSPTKWRLPDVTIAPGGYLVVFASGKDRAIAGSELHANFSLDADGEYLALVKPDGTTVVSEFSPTYPDQRPDVSYGFDADALLEGYFLTPTPGTENAAGFSNFVADTSFSVDRGFYDAPITVEITSNTPGAEIRYTTNGQKPTEATGSVYTAPVAISQTTVLRAAAYKPGHVPTNVDTHTYIFPADVIAHPNMRTSITQDPTYGPLMVDSLKSVPTISLVFQGDVDRAEKEASVELINFEAGSTQLDAGMERFGNYVTNFAKRSMRLNFRTRYGPGKLRFPVFAGHDYPIPPADEVDSINLRSGNHDMRQRGAYMSNRFTDDTMLDMGNVAPHGRHVHVYLNGLYWGNYHMRERWNAAMVAEYHGGEKPDYDAINANDGFAQNMRVYDGTGQQWAEAQSLISGPQPFANARGHIDMSNIFDFMLMWASGNCEAEYRSAGAPDIGVPFKFFLKDADGYLRGGNNSVTHRGPLSIMSNLNAENDPDYKILLADRIHKHYFNDGAFTPAKNIGRLQDRVDDMRLAFYSEAARWNERTPSSWESYQANLINSTFPNLTNSMIGKFRSAGYYPSTVAPSFNQHGGSVPAGFNLVVSAPAGTIYYTLDGTDPRESAEPVEVDPPVVILEEDVAKRVHVPTSGIDGFIDGGGNSWNEVDYDDSGWTAGTGGVGYDRNSTYDSYFDIDVEAEMSGQRTSCLIRIPFTLAAGALTDKNGADLRVRYDDGFVAYLNGTEIARRNFSGGVPDGNANATANHSDSSAIVLQSVDISSHLDLFVEGGDNVLAIHGLNQSTNSSDFLISAQLRVSESPIGGGTGGAISDTAIEYTGAIPVDSTVQVRSRGFDGTNWSAMNEATFTQDLSELVVSEIMYNPSSATAAEIDAGHSDSEDFEFLELLNTGDGPLDLTGLRFIDGITFDFTASDVTTLAAGARVVIVEDPAAFEFRYGAGLPVAGQYSGKLKDEGEALHLVDALDQTVRSFAYDNVAPWPTTPDGGGTALVLADPDSLPDHSLAASWTAGSLGGTPGTGETVLQNFADWAAANGVVDPNGDDDGDKIINFLEFFGGGDPNDPASGALPRAGLDAEGHATMSFIQDLSAGGVSTTIETSTDLGNWIAGVDAELVELVHNGDGTVTATYRTTATAANTEQIYIRLRVSEQ